MWITDRNKKKKKTTEKKKKELERKEDWAPTVSQHCFRHPLHVLSYLLLTTTKHVSTLLFIRWERTQRPKDTENPPGTHIEWELLSPSISPAHSPLASSYWAHYFPSYIFLCFSWSFYIFKLFFFIFSNISLILNV